MAAANTISILISQDQSQPLKQITGIPWYPGITVLQAMTIGQSMNPGAFSFRVVYHSFFGAFVDMIDAIEDTPPKFWIFSISNNPSPVGVSAAIMLQVQTRQTVCTE